MTHIVAFVPRQEGSTQLLSQAGARLLSRFKEVTARVSRDDGWAQVTLAPRWREESVPWAEDTASGVWLTWTGVWFYQDESVPALDADALLKRYLEVGASQLGLELQGQFVVVVGDSRSKALQVITDRCGNLHVFAAETDAGIAVSSSSAVLAACLGAEGKARNVIDPVGLHQFIATGVIYDDLTLWANVKKIGSGVVCRIDADGMRQDRYWRFADIDPEAYSLDESVERIQQGLTRSVKQIAKAFPRIVSDLTGGYDSRALLSGLLSAGVDFETTVSGPASSPDVVVSTQIAQAFNIRHSHRVASEPGLADLTQALKWTDGEYDVFDYARIAAVHTQLSARYQISLNGSFGELARGYWWELIWPNVTERAPLSGELLSRKRFAAVPYDSRIFSAAGQVDLSGLLAGVLDRTVAELKHFPKSSQMDAMYYHQRMDHWQGRIVSTTNQIWPCLSPFSFPQILMPILQTQANARIRSKLVRALLERHQPKLARIPLEHGYPPRLFSVTNAWQFLPLVGHYSHLVGQKLAPKIAKLTGAKPAPGQAKPSLGKAYPALTEHLGLGAEGGSLLLLETGLFNETALSPWFSTQAVLGDSALTQWKRLVTVELLLRRLREIGE